MITKSHFFSLPLRLMLGAGFIYHGFPKLFSLTRHKEFATTLKRIGVPLADISAWVVAAAEFFGGVLLILGLLVFFTSLALIVQMFFAMIKVHLPHGFSFVNTTKGSEGIIYGPPGAEVNLLYITGLLTLMLLGGGPFSIDHFLKRRRKV